MTTSQGSDNSADSDPLRLTICPNCFYNLHGLPHEGTCPECGAKYDQSGVVLYGWTLQEAAERSRSATTHWIGWILIAACIVVMFWETRRGDRALIRIWLLIGVGLMLYRVLQRHTLHAPARVQVRFDAAGIHINPRTGEFGFEPRRFVPWRKVGEFDITPHRSGGYYLHATTRYVAFFLTREYLQIVVELTHDQYVALRERTNRWQGEIRQDDQA